MANGLWSLQIATIFEQKLCVLSWFWGLDTHPDGNSHIPYPTTQLLTLLHFSYERHYFCFFKSPKVFLQLKEIFFFVIASFTLFYTLNTTCNILGWTCKNNTGTCRCLPTIMFPPDSTVSWSSLQIQIFDMSCSQENFNKSL